MHPPIAPPYYVVIFTSRKTGDLAGYEDTAERMDALCKAQPGFLKMVHTTTDAGESVTSSYWKDKQSIANWKDNVEHQAAQKQGVEKWYQAYQIEVAWVERAYSWTKSE